MHSLSASVQNKSNVQAVFALNISLQSIYSEIVCNYYKFVDFNQKKNNNQFSAMGGEKSLYRRRGTGESDTVVPNI